MSTSVIFSREEISAMKEGKARPDVELVRKTRASMAENAIPEIQFPAVLASVLAANPDVHRLYIDSNGVKA